MAKVVALSLVLWFLCQSVVYHEVTAQNITCEEIPSPDLDSYCVIPDCETPCPSECSSRCSDLDFFTLHASDYFRSHTIFHFINGTHEHRNNLTVEYITNMTFTSLMAEETVVIQCVEEGVGFVFIECNSVTIINIAFFRCCQNFETPHNESWCSALAFLYGSNVSLERVSVTDSSVQGMYIYGVQNHISVKSSSFNRAGHQKNQTNFQANYNISGNSIFAESKDDNIMTESTPLQIIIDNSSFISNTNRPECANARDKNGVASYCECKHIASGLALILRRASDNVLLTNLFFKDNSGCWGGNLAIVLNTSHPFNGSVMLSDTWIHGGRASFGGGLYIFYLSAPEMDHSNSHCNSEDASDSDIHIITISNTSIEGNKALSGGGLYLKLTQSLAICTSAKISITDNCTFKNNTLSAMGYGGAAIHSVNFVSFEYKKQLLPQFVLTISDSTLTDHYYQKESKWKNSGSGVIYLKGHDHVAINNIAIYGNNYSGIVIVDSNLIVSGSIEIYNNNGSSGGGMLFCSNGVMFLTPYSIVNITNNTAEHAGGGICVEDQCLQSKPACFFQGDYNTTVNPEYEQTIQVYLTDNRAIYAGDQIYGGSIDFCYLVDSPFYNVSRHMVDDSKKMYAQLFTIEPNETYSVTSPQRRVCICINNTTEKNNSFYYNCLYDTHTLEQPVFPGENFSISAVVVGQLDGIVPGTVYAKFKSQDSGIILPRGQAVQGTQGRGCTKLNYTIYTNHTPNVILTLGVQFTGDKSFEEHLEYFKPLELRVNIKHCPIGFNLTKEKPQDWQEEGYICDCLERLKQQKFKCYISNKTIAPQYEDWLGYSNDEYMNKTLIIYSQGCSLDYCKNAIGKPYEVEITSEENKFLNVDNQCAFNRTGKLCGECHKGYSVTLGSSQCVKDCTNTSLLLIPLFAVMGILLVVLLMTLNMTVTEGTVNGLLLYANIVQISNKVLFQGKTIWFLTHFFKGFIAWLNLDFGIYVCLYRGMDDYAKAWLQFLFPLYIWLITGVIIYLSRKFTIVARLVNRNGIKVLATLVLLSYTKMLRASIAAIHLKKLNYINLDDTYEKLTLCWYSDCNIDYMKGKHIPLGLFGAVSVICLLPFAFLLLCNDLLSKIKIFSCMWKLKPFLDAYTGPYTNEGRYWTGLLLVVRCGLYIASSFNHASTFTSLNVTIACIVIVLISITPWLLQNGVYRKRWLNILECSFLLNLGVLTTGAQYILYYKNHNLDLTPLTHTSVGIAFITFVFIIIYHICQFKTVCCLLIRIKDKCQTIFRINCNSSERTHTISEIGSYNATCSDSDEDLLSVSNFPPLAQFDKDREPLLSEETN